MTNKTEREAFEAWAHKNRVAANAFHFSIWQAAIESADFDAEEHQGLIGYDKNGDAVFGTIAPSAKLSTETGDNPVHKLTEEQISTVIDEWYYHADEPVKEKLASFARAILSYGATASDKEVDLGRTCRRCGHDAHFGSCVNLHPSKEQQ